MRGRARHEHAEIEVIAKQRVASSVTEVGELLEICSFVSSNLLLVQCVMESDTNIERLTDDVIPRVFLSYSWDNEDHKTWVRELASRLANSGVQVRLDQWFVKPGESFIQFMEQEVSLADVVVVVCTPEYARRLNERSRGVGFEGQILSARIYSGTPRTKFIPIIRAGTVDDGPECAIPTLFRGVVIVDFRDSVDFENGFEELLRAILNKPKYLPPPLGQIPGLASFTGTEPVIPTGTRRNSKARNYSSEFAPPYEVAEEALESITALSHPSTWTGFAITNDLSFSGWMGSDSETVIATLYSLFAPAAVCKIYSSYFGRNFALLGQLARLQFTILEAVHDSLTNDNLIAGLMPAFDYSPRVPNWRYKRRKHPQQYWWQGLSPERLEDALKEFIKEDAAGVSQLISREVFRNRYKELYNRGSDSAQQALGLAANALYGFTLKRDQSSGGC
jgi:TIR domain